MKKTITEIVEVEETRHEFYCDRCGKHLGVSYECEDGWYKELGNFELRYFANGWMRLKKCFCDKCKYEFMNELRHTLFNAGFAVE